MRNLFALAIAFFLVACTGNQVDNVDRIVLKTNRPIWLLSFFSTHQTYAIRSDGIGETREGLPTGLEDEPEWSPDGEWVVFDTLYRDSARAGGNADVYLMRADGSQLRRVTNYPRDDLNPTWSPDGKRIAYEESITINILNLDCFQRGENCHPNPSPLTEGFEPTWSPDGKRIVYVLGESSSEEGFAIAIIDLDRREPPAKLFSCKSYGLKPRWSPKGEKIVFACYGRIYVINPDGTGLTKLTEPGGTASWSPDGSKIAFVSSRDGLGECVGGLCGSGGIYSDAIFLMNADGNNVIRLSKRNDEEVLWYAWLPKRVPKNRR